MIKLPNDPLEFLIEKLKKKPCKIKRETYFFSWSFSFTYKRSSFEIRRIL